MARKRAVQADIAEQLGISQVAVSKALRDSPEISAALRERVLAAAEDVGYRPNLIARSLVNGRTHIVGYLAPSAMGRFLHHVQGAIHKGLQAEGFQMLFASHNFTSSTDDPDIHAFLDYHVDGILSFPKAAVPWAETLYPRLLHGRAPVVFLNQEVTLPGAVCVFADDRRGMGAAVDHLAGLGHRRIGHITSDWPLDTTVQRRLAGYRAGLEAAGIAPREDLILRLTPGRDEPGQLAAFLAAHPELTALTCYSDPLALHVYRWARDCGLNIPGDLSVVGFGDDVPDRDLMATPLTTVSQCGHTLGSKAVELLLSRLRGEQPEPVHITPTELLVGASTAPPATTPG